jgi:hypothetical protein
MKRKSFLVPNITGYRTYTPSLGSGFGTPTGLSFSWRQDGEILEVIGSFTTGTVAANLGSISLPTGNIDTGRITLANTTAATGQYVGVWGSVGNNANGFIVTALGTSSTLVYLGPYMTAAANQMLPANTSGNISSTSLVTVHFRVPIAGWKVNRRVF